MKYIFVIFTVVTCVFSAAEAAQQKNNQNR